MKTVLLMSSYFKGQETIRAAKASGAHVILLTEEKLKDKPWPRESIDEVFLMPDMSKLPDMVYAVAYLNRQNDIQRIVALDEYDVEMAAVLREHLRLDGLTITSTKRFRDKLIMRDTAQAGGIRVPPFTKVTHHETVTNYTNEVEPPWMLKPRMEAAAMGIKKVHNADELWWLINELGDQQSFRVLEQFIPGDVYHVDALTVDGETVFASVSKYGAPPMDVAHGGGIFTTYTLDPKSDEALALKKMNRELIEALGGLKNSPTHAEFIKAHHNGEFYFLEIAARVGGAHIAELVEYSTGINLWREWGRLEASLASGKRYVLPTTSHKFGGLLVSLAKQEHPDTSAYTDPEIVWRMDKKNHVGMIVVSDKKERTQELLQSYQQRFIHDFMAVAPPAESHDDLE